MKVGIVNRVVSVNTSTESDRCLSVVVFVK
jgi:hypothetical protein